MSNWQVEKIFNLPVSDSSEQSINLSHDSNLGQFSDDLIVQKPKNTRYLKISEASNLISIFDGHNISVHKFIRECKNVETLINPTDKGIFLHLVRSKIKGIADTYIDDKEFISLQLILEELKHAYAPVRGLSEWQSELSNILQGASETVLDYGTRTTKLLNDLIECIKETFTSPGVREGMIKGSQESALKNFIRGLHDRIESRISLKTLLIYKKPYDFQ